MHVRYMHFLYIHRAFVILLMFGKTVRLTVSDFTF